MVSLVVVLFSRFASLPLMTVTAMSALETAPAPGPVTQLPGSSTAAAAWATDPWAGYQHHQPQYHQWTVDTTSVPPVQQQQQQQAALQQQQQQPAQQQCMNTSSDGSTTSTSTKSQPAAKRTVNFKLEIKADPETASEASAQPASSSNANNVQKVPSISDLSDQESSVEVPAQQVRQSAES